MSESNAAVSSEIPHFHHAKIFSQAVYIDKHEAPGIGRFLSQGAAAGAIVYFFLTLFIVLSDPSNAYNVLYVALLAIFMVIGVIFGLIEGLVVWGSTKIAGRNLHPLVRAAIPCSILVVIAAASYARSVTSYQYPDPESLYMDFLIFVAYLVPVGMIGLVTGSPLQPWRALTRGSEVTRSRVFPGITGLIVRSLILFGLMDSIIALTCTLQAEFRRTDFVFTVIALVHFLAATAIVFARIKCWIVVQLALIINFPVVLLITDVLKTEPIELRYAPLIYLALWAAFLLARWRATYSALGILKEEFRYYLID